MTVVVVNDRMGNYAHFLTVIKVQLNAEGRRPSNEMPHFFLLSDPVCRLFSPFSRINRSYTHRSSSFFG